jgi:Prokaryotic Cytochrome C oxidase subunit IV
VAQRCYRSRDRCDVDAWYKPRVRHHTLASVVILLIAFIKVRLVGLYFMELRGAPTLLRGLFEAYCAIECTVVIGVFLLA